MMQIQDFIERIFTQTDFILLYTLQEKSLDLSELIEETGYNRDTVNTIIRRLLKKGMIERSEGKNGRYLYYIPEEEQVYYDDASKKVINYLIDQYKSELTPNICRIILYLLCYKSYQIADLVERGWKQSACYSSTQKLLKYGIVERTTQGYRLVISKKMMASESKKVGLGTLNFNDYQNESTKETRFRKFLPMVEQCSVWGLQEFIPKAYPGWKKDLEEKQYTVILPNRYQEEDSNCMITLLIINEQFVKEYIPLTLQDDKLFYLRYTYGMLKTQNGRTLRILNVHVPQSCNVNEKRKLEITMFWQRIIKEIRACRGGAEEFILMGDLNAYNEETEKSINAEYLCRATDMLFDPYEECKDYNLENDAQNVVSEWGYTWCSKDNAMIKKRLDYILISPFLIDRSVLTRDVFSSTISLGISDHKAVTLWYDEIAR